MSDAGELAPSPAGVEACSCDEALALRRELARLQRKLAEAIALLRVKMPMASADEAEDWTEDVEAFVSKFCPYSPATCRGHDVDDRPLDGGGGHYDCVGPSGPTCEPGIREASS